MEQYFTAAQFFAHLRRQLIGKPHVRQGLLGNAALLPRNGRLQRGMPSNLASPRTAVQHPTSHGRGTRIKLVTRSPSVSVFTQSEQTYHRRMGVDLRHNPPPRPANLESVLNEGPSGLRVST